MIPLNHSNHVYVNVNARQVVSSDYAVISDSVVKAELLTEAHSSPFTMHPGSTKMYRDLRQKPAGLLQPLSVPRWKWKSVSMDFITRLSRTLKGYTVIWVVVDRLTKSAHFIPGKSTYTAKMLVSHRSSGKYFSLLLGTRLDFGTAFHPQTDGQTESYQVTICMAPFEALYGRCCRSPVCWGEVGEQRLLGPELGQTIKAAIQKIRARSTYEGCSEIREEGKLSPRFVRPFEILEWIGPVAYRLALPPPFCAVHDVFHVSMLRKYVADPTHVVDYNPLQINENLSYEEQPVEILAREVKVLRNRGIALVKVLSQNPKVEEATWEREEDMRTQYPELFED
ncbi:pol protein [Cucumis melo var. makuwa]|uniref:Pol protein n=1 Tax=Cucumis melo var. makuwa TaxID=1194695 RepID=A0A5A7V7V4_CUCMM|nr:pol protein [Cucumis melo var. makuwa]